MKRIVFLLLGISIFRLQSSFAQQLRLPDYFSDNMVLQQHDTVRFWGWADGGQQVWIKAGWLTDTLKTRASSGARWEVKLPTPAYGGPYEITVGNGNQQITIHNILIGETWLCSGQSNMEFSANWSPITRQQEEATGMQFPEMRLFHVYKITSDCEQMELRGRWEICSPQTIADFSAVAYFFGRSLLLHLHTPVGLIESCWGGTPVETWMPDSIFVQHPSLAASAATLPASPWWPVKPGLAFNAMIAPLQFIPIAGVIWYQGETNTHNPQTYAEDLSHMIQSWRNLWQKEFPFYLVQIAPYRYETPDAGALIREAQLQVYRQVPRTGIVITTDITGDTSDIHPKDKQDVGERLALWALAKTYGLNNIVCSGPLYDSMKIEGNRIRIYFDFADDGLMIGGNGKQLTDIYIAGNDQHFLPAQAKIEKNTLVVWNRQIAHPVAVRFGFSNTAMSNLYNRAGLPASPFRTDQWPVWQR